MVFSLFMGFLGLFWWIGDFRFWGLIGCPRRDKITSKGQNLSFYLFQSKKKILGFKGWKINGQGLDPVFLCIKPIKIIIHVHFWKRVMILMDPVHKSNRPKPSPNQCTHARFQVFEKNLKIKKKLLSRWLIPIASGTW